MQMMSLKNIDFTFLLRSFDQETLSWMCHSSIEFLRYFFWVNKIFLCILDVRNICTLHPIKVKSIEIYVHNIKEFRSNFIPTIRSNKFC